jgi:hypothetical protein
MAGKAKILLDALIQKRTHGDPSLVPSFKIKLIMKGVDPDVVDASSSDNPLIIQRIMTIAREMGVEL